MTIQEFIDLLEAGWNAEERKESKILFSYDTGKVMENDPTGLTEAVIFEPDTSDLMPTLQDDSILSFGMDMAGNCHVDIKIPEGHYDIDVITKK